MSKTNNALANTGGLLDVLVRSVTTVMLYSQVCPLTSMEMCTDGNSSRLTSQLTSYLIELRALVVKISAIALSWYSSLSLTSQCDEVG
ncbi:hypothetical protein FKM82_012727 [Ascaphus truei]